MTGDNRLIAEWSEQPFTAYDKRHITVEHRVVADNVPGVGVDIRHQIRCEERDDHEWDDRDGWSFAEVAEVGGEADGQ